MTSSVLYVGSSKTVIEDGVFSDNAAGGPSFSSPPPGSAIRRTVFAYNGYTPLGANGGSKTGARNDFVVDSSIFYRNNTEKFSLKCTVSCGQAAAKFAHMVGLTLSNNLVEETRGSAGGLWCDLDCSDTTSRCWSTGPPGTCGSGRRARPTRRREPCRMMWPRRSASRPATHGAARGL